MHKLFSYCIPYDDGAAPNPYWGTCTLNICKPVIRRVAQIGDWVVGTGSKKNGFENKVVYAMKITKKLTMKEYESYCKNNLQNKIPVWNSKSYKKKMGDCIYDFSYDPPKILESVHTVENRTTDLKGEFALLSNHFYYFGGNPKPLPEFLFPIVHQEQGHKSSSNQPYFDLFLEWILDFSDLKNKVNSDPFDKHDFDVKNRNECAIRSKIHDENDEEVENL